MKPAKNNFSPLTSYLSRLMSHPGVRRYGINTAWLFTEQVLRLIAGFLVGVWVARYLGPEKFGLFSYALAFVSIFQGIAKLGLDGIVVRDLVQEPEKRDVYLGTSFWLKLLGGIITFLIITIILVIQSLLTSHFSSLTSYFSLLTSYLSPLTSNFFTETNIYILIIAFGIIFQSFEVIDFYYQATVQAKYIFIRKMIQLFLSSIIKIILVLVKADLIWFVLVTLFDAISLAIFSWLIYKSQGLPNFIKYFKRNTAKRLLKDSWPFIGVAISVVIYERIDQVMLKNMINDYSVGIYSAAVKITGVFTSLSPIFAYSFFPALVNSKKESNEKFEKRLVYLYSFTFWFTLLLSVIVCKFSREIVIIIYGNKFIETHEILSIYIYTIIFAYIGGISSRFYIIENVQNLFLINLTLFAIINIFLNLLLIPKFESNGAAIASLISFGLAAYISDIFFKKTRLNFKLKIAGVLLPFYYLFRNLRR
jgi:O-antigen/teichoic acid export membrane protein